MNFRDEEVFQEAALVHRAYLKIGELESLNILYANRWRQVDGRFRNPNHHDAFFAEMIRKHREGIEELLNTMDELVRLYPAFVVLPLVRMMGNLTMRISKDSHALEGAMFSVWKVLKRIESHHTTNEQTEDGWAVIRSVWQIMLRAQDRMQNV